MFTGIVTDIGVVADRSEIDGAVRFTFDAAALARRIREGDSVCVSGVCLTATEVLETGFRAEAVETTLSRTTLGAWRTGREANLESALAAGDPLGGHLVQGHVDGVAEVVGVDPQGETTLLTVRLPSGASEATVDRGSLTIDGVSLTVAGLEGDIAEFAIIPYTWSHTTFRNVEVGSRVNVEIDVIGKYVQRLIEPHLAALTDGRGSS